MYIVQKNEYTCAPVAIYNACKFYKKHAVIEDLISYCETDHNGTSDYNIFRCLHALGFVFTVIYNPNLDDLDHETPFILSHREIWNPYSEDYHMTFFEDINTSVNLIYGNMFYKLNKKEIEAILESDSCYAIIFD
jgi:ABC-type bacteriocin/lantibiotic exporter with double-glycine peptidase domain